MRIILLLPILLFVSGCATIGRDSVDMTSALLRSEDRKELQFTEAMDFGEDTARKKLEIEMMYVIGPEIVSEFLKLRFKDGTNFEDRVCDAKGYDRSQALLKFSMALSRKYERRKRKEWKPIARDIRESRRAGRNESQSSRQGLSALKATLKAYTKDKDWRNDVLRRVGAPVDQVAEVNRSAVKINERLEVIER